MAENIWPIALCNLLEHGFVHVCSTYPYCSTKHPYHPYKHPYHMAISRTNSALLDHMGV